MRFFEAVRQSAAQEAMALSGAYLLHGEEEYSKEQAVRQAAALPAEAARALNVQRLDAPAAADVQAACETLPFFDRCRVVVVRDLPAPEEAALAAYAPAVPETALLLAVRGGDTLVTLDDSLNQLASVAAGQAKSVSSTATAVYLLTASGVESYGYDGTHNWSRDYGAAPQAVINARETLVFISGTVEVLNAPHE